MSLAVKIAVALILAFLVIVPILSMFMQIRIEDFKSVFKSPQFSSALWNSVWISGVATLISVLLAYVLAYATVRANIYLKRVFVILLTLPMLIPSISHGMGLIILFGQNGIVTRLFNLQGSIYGAAGIIIGSVLYAFPVAYIMLSDVLKYEDMSVYEAANILGIGKMRQFLKLSLPYMKKPLIAAVFSVFSMIVTDYGVPLMIGGKTKTLSIMMYEEVIGQQEFGKGCVYGAFLMLPALIAFISDLLNKERAAAAFVKREGESKARGALDYAAFGFCIAVSVFVALPLIAFVVLSFAKSYPRDTAITIEHFAEIFGGQGGTYLLNSLIIALLAAIIGVILAYITAYLTARMKSLTSRFIHLLVLTFMAIPGIVLGISYVMTFSNSIIYGTIIILVMVNVAHFISSPYLMMYNSFCKMNENLEAVGATLGISKIRMIKDVFIPQNIGSMLEMFSYIFVNCMMTISAVAFLSSVFTKPISLMINQFEAQMQYESAAVVSLLIFVVNIIVKALISHLSKKGKTNEAHQKTV